MTENGDAFIEPFRRLVADLTDPAAIRAIENGGDCKSMWAALCESGFLDALVAEDAGGAGLSLADAFPLITALGEYAVPLPFAETMIARHLLASADVEAPEDAPILLAAPSSIQPFAGIASHALVQTDREIALVECFAEGDDPFRLRGANAISAGKELARFGAEPDQLLHTAAAVTAAQMAGSMVRMFDMAMVHANERKQFGRPLSKFQAIQHQLAVMAEQVISAQISARSAFQVGGFGLPRVAAAKVRANEAAAEASAIAHAVHAAIGMTEEFDLQLYSRRLKQSQLAFGSEAFWAPKLAELRLSAGCHTTADFIRTKLQDNPAV
jgi:acyl-CoA dehydrogenase